MILVLCFSCLVILLYHYISLYNFWKRKNVKQAPLLLAVWETTLQTLKFRSFRDNDLKNYSRFSKSRYVGVYHFTRPMLMITDPELIMQVAIKDVDRLSDHQLLAPPGADKFWDNNLFALCGKQWRTMRTTLSPSFTATKMRAMFVLMNDTALDFCTHFMKNDNTRKAVNMKETYRRYANDIIANCAFGIKCDSFAFPNNDFYLNGVRTTNFSSLSRRIKMALSILLPFVTNFTNVFVFDPFVSNFFYEKIRQQLRIREEEKIVRPDMIHLLLEARKEQLQHDISKASNHLSDISITAQALFFFSAAFDTVSSILSYISYELAVQPEIQERLRAEITATRSRYGDNLNYDNLAEMKYMEMVISEGLRKWPPIVFTDRRVNNTYTIHKDINYTDEASDLTLCHGDCIVIPIYAIHHDPNYYLHPDVFDPERFNAENRKNIKPYSYMPFGIGARICIGMRFALMEIKVLLFHLVSHFEIVVDEKTQIPAQIAKSFFNLEPLDGIWLRYNKLQDK